MTVNDKNAAKSTGRLLYRPKRTTINTPRFRHINPSSKMVLMREEKTKRAAMIREESKQLKDERVRTQTTLRQDKAKKIKAHREKRTRSTQVVSTKHYSHKVNDEICEINKLDTVIEIEPPQIEVTDELMMEVVAHINNVAMYLLTAITNPCIAELAAMEIAEIITTTLSNFHPTTVEDVIQTQTQLIMWIEMIISQALTVEGVAQLDGIESEAVTMIATITQLTEASPVIIPMADVFNANITVAIFEEVVGSTTIILILVHIRVPYIKPFRWCKRTRLKLFH